MVFATIIIGALLTLTGSGSFLLSKDLGTLIPMAAGLLLMGLGWWSKRPEQQALAGHLAVVLTFVFMVFSAPAANQALKLFGGEDVARGDDMPLAGLVLSIRWFLARKRSTSA